MTKDLLKRGRRSRYRHYRGILTDRHYSHAQMRKHGDTIRNTLVLVIVVLAIMRLIYG